MTPQLTLQSPLQLDPSEISNYLNVLWSEDQLGSTGANTFCLLVWQPAWIEQLLINNGKLKGPVIGTQREEMIEAARINILEKDLPHSTYPLGKDVKITLEGGLDFTKLEDQRGQHVDAAISALQPRRLITLAPTINKRQPLETLVAAYCPLSEEVGKTAACGDVIVLRGSEDSISNHLKILPDLMPAEMPSWLWWNGSLDESTELLNELASDNRRIIIDSAIGEPKRCLSFLEERVIKGQAINDLNWLRLRNWRETLAMVFDPPSRQIELRNVIKLDIDIEGNHPVQGLLLAAWISEKLEWDFVNTKVNEHNSISVNFRRKDGTLVLLRLTPLPVGKPSIHPGQIVGIRLICKEINSNKKGLCVILASESGECMRLEAGGMANMNLVEEVVPKQNNVVEEDIARLLSTSRGTTSPLLLAAAPIASKLFD